MRPDGPAVTSPGWQTMALASVRPSWDASPALIVVTMGPDHEVIYQNPASARLFGRRGHGRPVIEAFPELTADGLSMLDEVLRSGVTITEHQTTPGVRGADGEELLLTYVFAPLGPPGEPAAGVVLSSFDVTAEVKATRAAEQSALLSELSERMNGASDPDAALQELTDSVVPALADLAAVYVVPRDGPPRGAAPTQGDDSQAAPPNAMTVSGALLARLGAPPRSRPADGPSPWELSLAAGKTLLLDVSAGDLDERSDDAVLDWLRDARAHNMAVLPLTLAGQLAGAVVLLAVGERPPYSESELQFLELVASRAGSAVTQLRSSRQQRQIALDLQRALLPDLAPDLPGMRVAVRYVAGSNDVEIGGDWWDVHHIYDGHTGIGVGDVAGHGLQAAVIMGEARAAMRAASHAHLSPGAVLGLLDAQLADVLEAAAHRNPLSAPRFATAAYAVLDVRGETLCIANAGHPPMVLLTPDGRTTAVHAPPGPPLGLRLPEYEEHSVYFPRGSVLVAFTDGLVESRELDIDSGIAQVAEYLASTAGADVEDIADGLLTLMRSVAGHRDDTALVVLQSTPRTPAAA